MKFLSFIISSIFVASSIQPIPDEDGWVPVERPDFQVEELSDEEKGVWVVFSKEMEGEKFLVRFPDDPSYRYQPDGIQLDASQDGDHLRLQIEKRAEGELGPLFKKRVQEVGSLPGVFLIKAKESADGRRLDLFYRMDEKWVWEWIESTPKLLYTFHTESPKMSAEIHRQFISSLDIYKT